MSNFEFVYTESNDMHIHQWLHLHVAPALARAASPVDSYEDRRKAVIDGTRGYALGVSNRKYACDCAMAILGYGGGL